MRASRRLFPALLVVTLTASANAQTQTAATADALFRSGKEAVARGDLERGCAELAESQRLDPAIGTLLNLADCETRAGQLTVALGQYQAALDQMAPTDFRIPFAKESLKRLDAQVPRLTVHVKDMVPLAGMRLRLDDVELGPASLDVALPVDPGRHTWSLSVPGRIEVRGEVSVGKGEARTVELTAGALATPNDASPPPATPRVSIAPASGGAPSTARTAGFVAGGIGIAGLVVGTVTGVMTVAAANTYKDDCKNGGCNSQGLAAASTGRVTQWVSPVACALGVAGVAVSSYLLFFRPSPNRGVAVSPDVGPNGTGVTVVGVF
jgi:hypothetical protein